MKIFAIARHVARDQEARLDLLAAEMAHLFHESGLPFVVSRPNSRRPGMIRIHSRSKKELLIVDEMEVLYQAKLGNFADFIRHVAEMALRNL